MNFLKNKGFPSKCKKYLIQNHPKILEISSEKNNKENKPEEKSKKSIEFQESNTNESKFN